MVKLNGLCEVARYRLMSDLRSKSMEAYILIGAAVFVAIVVVIVVAVASITAAVAGEVEDPSED